jgi:hypothetical protein
MTVHVQLLVAYENVPTFDPINTAKYCSQYSPQDNAWPLALTLAGHGYAGQHSKGKTFRSEVMASINTVKSTIFRDVTPCSPTDVPQEYRSNSTGLYGVTPRLLLTVACLTYSSTLNMEAVCSAETSVKLYHTTRDQIFIATSEKPSNPQHNKHTYCEREQRGQRETVFNQSPRSWQNQKLQWCFHGNGKKMRWETKEGGGQGSPSRTPVSVGHEQIKALGNSIYLLLVWGRYQLHMNM